MNKKIRNEGILKIQNIFTCYGKKQRRHLLTRKESTLSNTSATSNTNTTLVKEHFLPDIPYKVDGKGGTRKTDQNALSITYYY